ncbi:hypothetical protein ACGYLX_04915 [Sulfitobacter sp. 1A13496]|uniref:hypothetical protein n=1 Tax=Sulfitobacter sp. 1A13496 TaxID=3368596 RepID=UPI003745477A
MKIGLTRIILAHIATLKNVGSEKTSRSDILVFFGIPILGAIASWHFCLYFTNEVYSASISVFAIFSALLFSVQVAMYGVFRSDRKSTGDKVLDSDDEKFAENARVLLREVNANISYLILISCVSVTIFLVFVATPIPARIEAAGLVLLYSHFLLTVAMVLKRAHEIFDAEYAAPLRFKSRDQ